MRAGRTSSLAPTAGRWRICVNQLATALYPGYSSIPVFRREIQKHTRRQTPSEPYTRQAGTKMQKLKRENYRTHSTVNSSCSSQVTTRQWLTVSQPGSSCDAHTMNIHGPLYTGDKHRQACETFNRAAAAKHHARHMLIRLLIYASVPAEQRHKAVENRRV